MKKKANNKAHSNECIYIYGFFFTPRARVAKIIFAPIAMAQFGYFGIYEPRLLTPLPLRILFGVRSFIPGDCYKVMADDLNWLALGFAVVGEQV